jgi:uncharacterized damage-inducible protein DinB
VFFLYCVRTLVASSLDPQLFDEPVFQTSNFAPRANVAVNSLRANRLTQISSRGKMDAGAVREDSPMAYDFLVETYETERIKVVSVWSEFRDEDLPVRPRAGDPRGRSVHEQMVHQCVSEDLWFRTMLGIDVGAPPLPTPETRLEFIKRYAADSAKRLEVLRTKDNSWWEAETKFFDVQRSHAWVMVRRIAHTAHHRGQQMAILRMLGRDLHSNYGPTADTGGLMQNHAPTIYTYPSLQALLEGESRHGAKTPLPGAGGKAVTERPDSNK